MVDAVLGVLLDNLSSLLQTEFGLLHGVKDQVDKLSLKLSTVRAVIEDAETRQYTDKAIAGWLRRLKDTAYDAEDVLDVWLTEVRRSEFESGQLSVQCFASCFHFNQPVFRHKIAKKIKNVLADFDSIAGDISKYDLKIRVDEQGSRLYPNRETSSSLVEPDQVYGREEDQRKIVDILIGDDASSPDDVAVLPILGVGGLGKTTLAQLVYNDERVSNYFQEKMWVCVDEDFDVIRLTTSIIECLSGKTNLTRLESLQNHLKDLLSGRRFLLVLDDVWNEDRDAWGRLKQSLTCGAKGSSILVTTRLEDVALMMATLPLYHLPFLSDDECWALFKGRACGMDEEDLSADLVEIGKQIVKKCGGVPLATKVLGALVRSKRDVKEWESIRESDIWELPKQKGDVILGVLRLSYNHLPPELRQCFSYCSLYPKDHEFEKTELVKLWMANGFVRCTGRRELEDVGNDIFNELLRGSFFQDPQKDDSGNVVKCKMHDLMHDLACSLTKNECCAGDIVPGSVRHLSLVFDYDPQTFSNYYKSVCKWNKSLRTHLKPMASTLTPPLQMIFSKLKYLRVLDLSLTLNRTRIPQVPYSIGGMTCLRYLDLSSNIFLRVLPDSICSLINLQTLNLNGCLCLTRLPKHMRKMRSLRHLDIVDCYMIMEMPMKMGEMIGLRTLSKFIVGKKKGYQINELNGLKHLSGELELERLELVKDSTEAKEADLANKLNLSSLSLSLDEEVDEEKDKKKSERVLEWLQPHVNLNKKLTINGYPGFVFPSWISLLQNLREIQLSRCGNCETLPPLGQLPLLQILWMIEMKSLKCIGVEIYGEVVGDLKIFPSLEKLELRDMPNLEKWEFPSSSSLLIFPCLRSLHLEDCPKLETPSNFIHLNDLSVVGVSSKQLPRNLIALETLDISTEDSTISEEIEHFTALKILTIRYCPNLISLLAEGLQKLTSLNLNSLDIDRCKSITSLPAMGRMIQEGMTMKSSCCSLVFLSIARCHSLTSVSEGLRYLTSLETLEIWDCNELELKKEDFQHLTCLRHLKLYVLPKLTSIPDVQNLTALQSLRLHEVENLRMLPEGLQHLTSLQSLQVQICHPDLHKRIKKNKGVDWPKISHIPNVYNNETRLRF